MNSLPTTVEQIESAVIARDDGMIQSSVFLAVLQTDLDLVVYLDPTHNTISERQLEYLNRLVAVPSERLEEIKVQLHDRWWQYDHFYTDEVEFNYETVDESYAATQCNGLYLHALDHEFADSPMLRFAVAWDPEHGAGVYYKDDQFHWCP